MSYEVEMKFQLSDLATARSALIALGAKPDSTHTEVDLYLQHPARSFAGTDEALRVRQIGSRILLTYKGPKIDADTKTRTEIELEITEPRGGTPDVILFWEHLGFRPVREVRKDRELFEVPWLGRQVHACLDRVAGLGEFLELELSCEPAQLEESRQTLKNLAEKLKLLSSERRSYLELLLENDAAAADSPENTEDWNE